MKSLIVALLLLPGSLYALEVKQIRIDRYQREGAAFLTDVVYSFSHAGQKREFTVEFSGSQATSSDAALLVLADVKAKVAAQSWKNSIDSPPADPVKTTTAADRAVSL